MTETIVAVSRSAARLSETRSAAAYTESRARCAYRAVVWTLRWPRSLPSSTGLAMYATPGETLIRLHVIWVCSDRPRPLHLAPNRSHSPDIRTAAHLALMDTYNALTSICPLSPIPGKKIRTNCPGCLASRLSSSKSTAPPSDIMTPIPHPPTVNETPPQPRLLQTTVGHSYRYHLWVTIVLLAYHW